LLLKTISVTNSSIHYRQATPEDVPALARIRAAEWESEEYWQRRIADYMSGSANPQHASPPRIVYLAEQNDVVVGFIAGHLTQRFRCDGELEWINVTKEKRGSAIASGLLQLVAKWFEGQGALRVCVDVTPDNVAARSFYRRHGAVGLNPHWLQWLDIRIAASGLRADS
jgi:ribosomal protein S18 acetylase RimI-like enzyme